MRFGRALALTKSRGKGAAWWKKEAARLDGGGGLAHIGRKKKKPGRRTKDNKFSKFCSVFVGEGRRLV